MRLAGAGPQELHESERELVRHVLDGEDWPALSGPTATNCGPSAMLRAKLGQNLQDFAQSISGKY